MTIKEIGLSGNKARRIAAKPTERPEWL